MTLESWSMGIVRPVMVEFPHAWMFFVPFIAVTTFAVLNLFVGIIVDAMQSQHQADAHAEREAMISETGTVLGEVTGNSAPNLRRCGRNCAPEPRHPNTAYRLER